VELWEEIYFYSPIAFLLNQFGESKDEKPSFKNFTHHFSFFFIPCILPFSFSTRKN
jgi:hypothetical protein